MDIERITKAYEALADTKRLLANAAEREVETGATLHSLRLAYVSDGKIVGKNEQEREACARDLLFDQYAALDDAQRVTRACRLKHDLAALAVEQLRMEMRLLEYEHAEAVGA